MDESNQTLGQEPTKLLLEEAEAGRQTLTASEVERLDRSALLSFLASRGIPPGPWPAWIEIRPALKAELWMRILDAAKKGWAALATLAFDDLAPDAARSEPALDVARRGIENARARGGSPLDWQDLASRPAYPELQPLLTVWARENVVRMRSDWETAYIVLGDDPGGIALASANIFAPVAGRLVTRMCEALKGPHEANARAWLEALATSPLRDIVPLEIKLDLPGSVGDCWAPLARLRQAYEGHSPSADAAPPEHQPFLERELQALAQRDPAGTPDVAALSAQLGGALSGTTLKTLARWTRPSRPEGPSAGAAWLTGIAAAAREQTGKLADFGARAAKEQTGKLAELGARARQKGKMTWPKFKVKAKRNPQFEPQEVESLATELPAAAEAEVDPTRLTELQNNMHEWIRGGSAQDDRRGDEELIRLFEESSEDDLSAVRQAIAGFSVGVLYRLASRASLNPRLLDGVARVVDEATLDTILLDIVEYDLWGFAPQAAERLFSSREGSYGPLEQAVIRLLREGPAQAREALSQNLNKLDRSLLGELLGSDRKAG